PEENSRNYIGLIKSRFSFRFNGWARALPVRLFGVSIMSFVKSLCIAGMLSALSVSSVSAETLEGAVANTLANHPSIDGAIAGVQASQEEKRAQASGYFPKVNLNTTAGREFANNSTSRGLSVVR